jgi:hypothetical protein
MGELDFNDFAKPSKESWLDLIAKELNAKIETIPLSEGISFNPFLQQVDKKGGYAWSVTNEIVFSNSQHFNFKNAGTFNLQLLEALEDGVGCLSFGTDIFDQSFDFEQVFKNIYLDLIVIKLDFSGIDIVKVQFFLREFIGFLKAKKIEPSSVTLFIICEDDSFKMQLFSEFDELNIFFQITENKEENVVGRLVQMLHAAEHLFYLTKGKMKFVFTINSEENFYLNLAKNKAIRILWENILASYNLVCFDNFKYLNQIISTNLNPNLVVVAATQQAIAAFAGGVDFLEIKNIDYSSEEYPEGFSERISRNIFNVLVHESKLNWVVDSSLGAYGIDDLVSNLINSTWEKFKLIKR